MGRRGEYIFIGDRQDHRVRRALIKVMLSLVLLFAVIVAFSFAISHQVKYDTFSVTIPSLPDDLENWTILQFSDLQGTSFGTAQSGISSALGTVNVSSVVMTGDMIGKSGDIQPLLDLLEVLPSDKPKLLFLGDEDPDYLDPTAHGSLSPYADWAQELVDAGVTILDEPVLFTRGTKVQARIWFIPAYLYTLDLDSYEAAYQSQLDRLSSRIDLTADEAAQKRVAQYQVDRIVRIREAIASIQSDDIQIAVSHVPVTAESMTDSTTLDSKDSIFTLRQVDLILSGHYCAGQFRLPGYGAVYVPGLGAHPSDTLITGLSYLNSVPQYISPGLATSSIYEWWQSFRFINQPVVTRITLTAKAS